MARWYEAANEASFKPTAGSYVFQSPNPWLFGWPRYYLVTETQKSAILPVMGRWRLLLLLCALAQALILGAVFVFMNVAPAAFLRLMKPALQFGVVPLAIGIFVLMMIMIAPLLILPQLYLNRSLAPILANAPRSNERIEMGEQFPKIAGLVPGWVLALGIFGGICIMAAAASGLFDSYLEGQWTTRRLLWPFLPLFALGGLVTFYFGHLGRLRARQRSAAAAEIDTN